MGSAESMKTELLLTITHTKPLDLRSPLTDTIAGRVYGYLYSQGYEVGVKAELRVNPDVQADEVRGE